MASHEVTPETRWLRYPAVVHWGWKRTAIRKLVSSWQHQAVHNHLAGRAGNFGQLLFEIAFSEVGVIRPPVETQAHRSIRPMTILALLEARLGLPVSVTVTNYPVGRQVRYPLRPWHSEFLRVETPCPEVEAEQAMVPRPSLPPRD